MVRFFLVLAAAIVLLVLMIVKAKVHPVLAIFAAGLGAGLAFGFDTVKAIAVFTAGFGSTLAGVGCTIIFGSIIAMSIQDTGAIKTLVNSFVRLFKGKRLELSTGLSAFIMSIPIFGDVTSVLASPVCAVISKRKRISMSTMSTWTTFASSLTHSLVPPTPGILAVTILLGADVGMMIVWSTIVSLATYFAVYFLLNRWVDKEWIPPREDYVKGVEEVKTADYRDLLIKEKGLPSVFVAVLPILLPVVLIAGASFAGMNVAKDTPLLAADNPLRVFLTMTGERNIAMFIGVLSCFICGMTLKGNIIKNSNLITGENCRSFSEIVLNKWVGRALGIALLPLMITAMGGGFSSVIRAYPDLTKQLSAVLEPITQYKALAMFVPWLIGAIMMIAVGSRTTAGMTAAGIMIPMMGVLGLTPLQLALLIGSGTLVGSHVSDSGFWVSTQLYNLNTAQGFKYITFIQSAAGVVSFIIVAVLTAAGIVA